MVTCRSSFDSMTCRPVAQQDVTQDVLTTLRDLVQAVVDSQTIKR